ncbi:MAG: TlpA family protein disulfide reductase [Phycisphaerales bacterium]|nr:TlpA family protein disulfide reductase [Phycisphaerales bacterium]
MRAITCLLAGLLCAAAVGADEYRRLGEGERLVTLAELETGAFAADLLATLDGWSGEPITPERLDGRVLVLMAWENDEARSVRLLPKLARLERERGDEVLILALHAAEGWDGARDRIDAGRVTCSTARDADGFVFEALGMDDHPNLYLVDRAGNVRVADIDPRDLDKAIGRLARESPDEARADLPRRVERLAALRKLTPPDKPGADGTPASGTPVSVTPEAYASAAWPEHNLDRLPANNLQGRKLPVPLGGEKWLTPKPERPLESHVLVLDFWATWCRPCINASPKLDALQREHKGDLVVLAISGQSRGSAYPEDEDAVRAFMRHNPVSYAHLNDPARTLYSEFAVRAIPHTVIVSTDGVVRWQGNPLSPVFSQMVEQVVNADPLLAARRAAGDDD